MKILKNVHLFLQKRVDFSKPLLLGYSGGPDSEALLQLLLELKKEFSFSLHIAHVDHGWRKESEKEALFLQDKILSLGLPFHCKKLSLPKGNLEALSREMRYAFFLELHKKIDFSALLLAHQKEDVAETALKRIFEGAHLPFLGMEEASFFKGLLILRPLLAFSKKDLLSYLKDKQISFLDDRTNRDEKYLRSRMRKSLFPYLEELFGKNIVDNLFQLSKRSSELKDFFQQENFIRFENRLGIFYELSRSHLFLDRHRLKEICKREDFFLSREQIELLLQGKRITWKEYTFIWSSTYFFAVKLPKATSFVLKEGVFRQGIFHIEVKKGDDEENSWQKLLSKRSSVLVEKGAVLVSPKRGMYFGKKSLGRYYQQHHVPLLLRETIPVIVKSKEVIGEFLTGNTKKKGLWKVSLSLID